MWFSVNSPVVCHRAEKGGREGDSRDAERSRAWGNPFPHPPHPDTTA